MRRTLIYIALMLGVFIITLSCKKFAGDPLNDNELFARLQAKGGTWTIETYEKWNNTETNPTIETIEAEDEFFHFYVRSSVVSGSLIDINTVDHYKQNSLFLTAPIQAQLERVLFEGGIGGGIVWTVTENKPNRQVWTYVNGDNVNRVTMKRCDCTLPEPPTETGG